MANTQGFAWQNPDAFVGRVTLSAYEPYQMQANSTLSSLGGEVDFVKWVQPAPVAVKNIVLQCSMNAIANSATSAASSGSNGYSYALSAWLFSRQDYGANSSNLSYLTSGSFGLSASLTYTGTAQSFGLSWVTDTTGGTSNLTTNSNAAGWSAYATGQVVLSIPLVTTLSAGEYWLGIANSSTTLTSNSNITLMSMSVLEHGELWNTGAFPPHVFGQSVAVNLSNQGAAANGGAIGGVAAPTTSTTMALSVLSAAQRAPWFALSNV